MPLPLPEITPENEAFWTAGEKGELRITACKACDHRIHPPQLICPACLSRDVTPVLASGRGTVHSWTVAHHAFHPAFKGELPYTLVIVDLAEGPRMLGRFETAADVLCLGLPVSLRFDDAGLPIFAAA